MNVHDYNVMIEHDKTRCLNPYMAERSGFYGSMVDLFGRPELVLRRGYVLAWDLGGFEASTKTEMVGSGDITTHWYLPWRRNRFYTDFPWDWGNQVGHATVLDVEERVLARLFKRDLRNGTANKNIKSGRYCNILKGRHSTMYSGKYEKQWVRSAMGQGKKSAIQCYVRDPSVYLKLGCKVSKQEGGHLIEFPEQRP